MTSTSSTSAAVPARLITAVLSYRIVYGIIAAVPLVLLVVTNGIQNKPVAEDYLNPRAFLAIEDHSLFRPGFALPLMAMERIFGRISENPVPYHAYSLLLHVAVILVFFWISKMLTGRSDLSILVAAVFALYPRHHEVVYWPAASAYSMMALFFLLCFGFAILAQETGSISWRLLSIGSFAISILSHSAAAIVIPLLVAYSLFWHWDRQRRSLFALATKLVRQLWPYVAISAGYGVILIIGSMRPSQFTGGQGDTSFYHLTLNASILRAYGGYVSYATLPFVHLRSVEAFLPKMALLLLAGALLASVAFVGGRLSRFGVVWILLTSIPFAVLVPFGNADRYFYLPAMGWSFVVVDTAMAITFRVKNQRRAAIAGVAPVVLAVALIVYATASLVVYQHRRDEWRSAGIAANALLDQIYAAHPTVTSDTKFYFLNMPAQYGQARFMSLGLGTELRRHYGDPSLIVNSSSDPGLISAVQSFGPEQSVGQREFVYQYERQAFTDRSSSVDDPLVQSMLRDLTIATP